MRELKQKERAGRVAHPRRTPHGVRELKPPPLVSWGVVPTCRTPHGVRELKHVVVGISTNEIGGRTPHGVRELKHQTQDKFHWCLLLVAPRTGCVN